MILGLGSDLSDIRRVQASLDRFGDRFKQRVFTELERTRSDRKADAAASEGARLGLEVHAGHGIDYGSVTPVAAIPEVVELNIGHFLIGEAIFVGLAAAIQRMRALMDEARAERAA